MDAFQKFQAEAVEKIRERLVPNWHPADPATELPFNLSPQDWTWFDRNVPYDAPNIHKLTTAELKALFPKEKSRTLIIRTFIWQCWLLIQMGQMRPLESTLRSLWYRELERFMRRHHLVKDDVIVRASDSDSDEDAIVEIMREQIGLFVEHRIFRYCGAFQFVPTWNAAYKIGKKRRGWFFFTEKVGLWKSTCLGLYGNEKLSCSVMASTGEPSGLTMEQMGTELKKLKVQTLLQFTFADLDPWGWWIDASLDAYMRRLGFDVQTWRLTTADLFTEDDAAGSKDFTHIIEKFKENELHPSPSFSPTSKESLINNWFKLSNGFHGRPLAMHCDNVLPEVREARIQQFLKEAQKKKPNYPGILVAPAEDQRLLAGPPLVAPDSLRRKFR